MFLAGKRERLERGGGVERLFKQFPVQFSVISDCESVGFGVNCQKEISVGGREFG